MKKKWVILCLIEAYQLGTLFLYLISPIQYRSEHNATMAIFVVLYQLMFVGGYLFADRYLIVSHRDHMYLPKFMRPIQDLLHKVHVRFNQVHLNDYMWVLCILSFMFSYNSLVRFSISVNPIDIFQDLMAAIKNPDAAYYTNVQISEMGLGGDAVTMLSTLLAPFYYMIAPLGIYKFKQLTIFNKILLFLVLLMEASTFIIRGQNIGIFRIVLILATIVLLKLGNKKSTQKSRRRVLLFAGVLFVGFVFYFVNGTTARVDNLPTYIGLRRVDYDAWILQILPKSLWMPFLMISTYLIQGYYGLATSFRYPFTSTFGIGSGYFLIENIKRFVNIDVFPLTYQAKMTYLWPARSTWHTAYTWFANDVSHLGVLLVLFVIGVMTYIILNESLKGKLIAILLLPLITLMIFFLPANNVVLSTPYTAVSFVAFLCLFVLYNNIDLDLAKWRKDLKWTKKSSS